MNEQTEHLPGLQPHHLAQLRASGLTDATILAAGIRSETSPDTLAAMLGMRKPTKGLAPAIVFPYVAADGTNGYYRVKPDSPRMSKGKPVKYESPREQPNRVYLPPGVAKALEDTSVELALTEGEKKSLAVTQYGPPCLGLVGVFGWKAKRGEKLLPELERVAWQGRRVAIVFDSDVTRKPEVADAEARLAKQLTDRGASVRCVRLPDGQPGDDGQPAKMGADDFLVAHGPAAFHKLLSEAVEPEPVTGAEGKEDAKRADPGVEAKAYLATTEVDGVPTLRFWLGDWWQWQAGAYRRRDAADARARLVRRLDRNYRNVGSGVVSCILDHVKAWSILSSEVEPGTWLADDPKPWPAAEVLTTRNEMIHLPTLERRPVTPKLFTTAALDFEFEPMPPRPEAWLNFLDVLWQGDAEAIESLQEWFGYLLVPDTSLQKILLLVGPPRSGKGTIGRMIREQVGARNVVGPTLAGLATNFGLEPLLGKSVAIVSDARVSGRTDSAVTVERLLAISGEDALTLDRKFNSSVTCKLPTRFVILSNELPRLADTSGAMASRFVVLKLRESFLGREDTTLFEAKLRPELPAILWWAIAGWQRLRQRGYFLQPECGRELTTELADLQSPIGAFVRECCDVEPIREVKRADLYAKFTEWSEQKGRKRVEDEATFGRGLRAVVPGVRDSQHRDDYGKPVRYYAGIGLQ